MARRCRFVAPAVVRLTLSDDEWIDVKKELTAGEERDVFAGLVKDMPAGEKATLDPSRVGITRIVQYVVGWSLLDQEGRPTKFTEAALRQLDTDTYAEISAAVDAHADAVDKAREERKNGPSSAQPESQTLPSLSGSAA